METLKKALTWAMVITQIAILTGGFIVMFYSLFTGTKISELINYDWWIFFFLISLWGESFTKSRTSVKQ